MKKYLSEGIGTFFLVAVVIGSGIMAENLANGNMAVALLGNTIATGAILFVIIKMFGSISGAHFNPAVSLVFYIRNELNRNDLFKYIIVQIAGALIAMLVIHYIFEQQLIQTSKNIRGEFPLLASEIIATIFTHRHADHIGDLKAISEMYTAPIWATLETHAAIPECDTDLVLKEGDSFQLGDVTWSIIETPGHCPGQLCLVSEAGIISADNVVQVGTILVPSGEGDMTRYIEGLHRLRDLDANLLFPGHGPMVANPTKLLTHYIEHRQKRHEAVYTAWHNGLREIEELSHAAYADTPDAHPLLKIDQTMSHLDALRNEGRI